MIRIVKTKGEKWAIRVATAPFVEIQGLVVEQKVEVAEET